MSREKLSWGQRLIRPLRSAWNSRVRYAVSKGRPSSMVKTWPWVCHASAAASASSACRSCHANSLAGAKSDSAQYGARHGFGRALLLSSSVDGYPVQPPCEPPDPRLTTSARQISPPLAGQDGHLGTDPRRC